MADPIANNGIVATAFELLELRPISSLADTSPKAVSAARAFGRALRMCLEIADWSFARAIADLSEITAPQDGYVADTELAYGYVLPDDLVKIRRIEPADANWRVDKGFLRADQPGSLRVIYTAEVSDLSKLPETFQIAVAYKMAALLPHLQTSRAKRAALISDAQDALAEALEADRVDASPGRYDDGADMADWAAEAVL